MGANTPLDKKTIPIWIEGKLRKIVEIGGVVSRVYGVNRPIKMVSSVEQMLGGAEMGHQKHLNIHLFPETSTDDVSLINFKGTSPVIGGDCIKAGLIVNPSPLEEVIYVGILREDGSYKRIDFMDGFEPLMVESRKLGLTY